MFGKCFDNVRQICPLVHNITNYVTVNDVANVLLAAGASPVMSDGGDEKEITAISGALNINIGTLNKSTIHAMFRAGKTANKLNRPVVLDPVGAGASALRTKTALKLIKNIKFSVIRGNISEIKTLALGSGKTRGVDAAAADSVNDDNIETGIKFVKEFAKSVQTVIAVTGKIDLVSDGEKTFVIRNGRAEMGKITGTGCQLSSIIAAFIAANKENVLEAAAAAVCLMGTAGEIAWTKMLEGDGNSTYRNRIIDTICNMTGSELEKNAKYEIR